MSTPKAALFHGVYNLYIGAVPYILLPGDTPAKILKCLPVLFCDQFVAVPPNIEQPGDAAVRIQKLLRQFRKLVVPEMAGWIPGQRLAGEGKRVGGNDGAAVRDADLLKGMEHTVVIGAEGVRHAADTAPVKCFKNAAVKRHFVIKRGVVQAFQMRVRISMAGDFMAVVQMRMIAVIDMPDFLFFAVPPV